MWKNNSLSIVTVVLFLASLTGQSVVGWKVHTEDQRLHQLPAAGYAEYLMSGEFGESVFENWESEFLQMGFYVLLTVFLFQRGSAESKKHDGTDQVEEEPEAHRDDPGVPGPVRAGGWRLAVYKNSLGLAFLFLFVISFTGHALSGARKHAAEQAAHGVTEPVGALAYMGTSQFWFESLQNWQSEFLAVLAIVVLSIHLRQWGSPESKPVHAPHAETGAG